MCGYHRLGRRLKDVIVGGLGNCRDIEQVYTFAFVILRENVLRGAVVITEDIVDGFVQVVNDNLVSGIGSIGEQLAGLDTGFQGIRFSGCRELLMTLNWFNSIGLCVLSAH